MILELHLLQNFAPSNLNRDDTGSPKDCEFGGFPRARISSQCQKRAIRQEFTKAQLLPADALGERTRLVAGTVSERLTKLGHDPELAARAANKAVRALGLAFDKKNTERTEYLVFIGRQDIEHLVAVCQQHWEEITEGEEPAPADPAAPGRAKKVKKETPLSGELTREIGRAWEGGRAVDIALFGRMIADAPIHNRHAASQVAHALSTNRVTQEWDFFTAVDDLKTADEDAGAGMMGSVEFNSSCFYRYLNVDTRQLTTNLAGDAALTSQATLALVQAAIAAIPSGKQNTFAAHNPPSLVYAVARDRGLCSLANAFVQPIAPAADGSADLIGASIRALDSYAGRMDAMYGEEQYTGRWLCVDPAYAASLTHLNALAVPAIADLLDAVRDHVGGADAV